MTMLRFLALTYLCLALAAENCDRCQDGLVQNPDNQRRCRFYDNPNNASLIVSSFNDIRMISLGGQKTTQIIRNGTSITGFDYNFRTNTIFWFSDSDKTIYTAPIMNGGDTTKKQSIIMQDNSCNIHGLAVDWIHDHIYWVDRNKEELVMSDLNGRIKKVLFNNGFQWPLCIAVNPLNGWMFWTDSIADRIERAGLDGSRREVIVSTNANFPQGLALDFVESRLYWSQGNSPSSIWSTNFDGSDTKLVFTPILPQLPGVGDFRQIAVFDKYVFFIDWETDVIRKVDICNGQELETMYESILWDMKIYHPAMQPERDNQCSKRIGQCSHFCLPVPSLSNGFVITTKCACPDGLLLSRDEQNCVEDLIFPISESTNYQ